MVIQATRRMVTDSGLDVRAAGKGVTVEGYASTFDQPYNMGWYSETVERGAFTRTLKSNPDVRFLVNHDGLPLARTTSGTLQLSQDSTGLHIRSQLDSSDPDVQRLVPKMQRGDLNQMSFAFGIVEDEWSDDDTKRSLRELSLSGGDVSVVTYPANPNAGIALRMRTLVDEDPVKVRKVWNSLRNGSADVSPEQAARMAAWLEAIMVPDQGDVSLIDVSDLFGAAEAREAVAPDVVPVEAVAPVPAGMDARDLRRLIEMARRA